MSNEDPLIIAVENWLNDTYSDHPKFDYLKPEGRPGNTVVGRLTMALQIELGIENPVPSFGPATEKAFRNISRARFDNEEERHNLVYILQGAFWAKGYSPGTFDGKFTSATENAIHRFQSDVGFVETTGIVDVKLMKALLNTDGFRLAFNGNPTFRIIQQILNTEYAEGFFDYIPTNGVYERQTNRALIYALQIEIGLESVANGSYGPATIRNTPTLRPGNSRTGVNRILQFGLSVNGLPIFIFDGEYSSVVEDAVREFQEFMTLPATGIATMPTIKQLLTSNGHIERSAIACDASMIINENTAQTLINNGYEVIGRYLTGTVGGTRSKAMTHEELSILQDKGIRVFPIYQDGGSYPEYFSKEQGYKDAQEAVNAAYRLGFPEGTTIYFAVDFDAYDFQVSQMILPYMTAIREVFDANKGSLTMPTYELGVYGPRNVCIRCAEEPSIRAIYSFVANMSTGFSGNLGFPMPENWAFGQFYETSIGSGSGYLEIDKNDYSGRDRGASNFTPNKVADRTPEEVQVYDEWKYLVENVPLLSNNYFLLSPQFEFEQTYTLVDTVLYRLETTASVAYSLEGEFEGLTFNVVNGEIEGSIEENLGEESSVLTSFGLSMVEETLQSFAFGVDNGVIAVSLEIVNDEIHVHMDLVRDDIETNRETLSLLARVTMVLKLNPLNFSQETLENILYVVGVAGFSLAIIAIAGAATTTLTGAGLLALLTSSFAIFNP